MSEKKSPPKPDTNETLKVTDGKNGITKGMTNSQIVSTLAVHGVGNAYVARKYAMSHPDQVDITDIFNSITQVAQEVADGNLNKVETILVGQAIALDAMFQNLALRSSKAEYMKNLDTYMRLALKAQSQCRTTIEAIGMLKNPAPYIRQANIAHGHQQVNNTYATPSVHTVAPKSKLEPSKLMEGESHEWMDTRAPSQTGASNQDLEALGAVDRP